MNIHYSILIITILLFSQSKQKIQFKNLNYYKKLKKAIEESSEEDNIIIETKDFSDDLKNKNYDPWYSDTSLDKSKILSNYTNWMKNLNDNIPLNNISIPGTHDTCTFAFKGPKIIKFIINLLGATQSWNIEEQLFSGIRYFDIRLSSDGKIYHGILKTTSSFINILNSSVNFLNENPSEGIIMRLQYTKSKSCDSYDCFEKNVINVLNEYKNYLLLVNEIPKLGEIRGKILIICEGMDYENAMRWNDHNMIIQDYWEFKGNIKNEYETKIDLINEFFEKSIDSKYIIINHISANGFYSLVTIKSVAYTLNKVPYEKNTFKGIIPMDFQSENIVMHIIDQNFID